MTEFVAHRIVATPCLRAATTLTCYLAFTSLAAAQANPNAPARPTVTSNDTASAIRAAHELEAAGRWSLAREQWKVMVSLTQGDERDDMSMRLCHTWTAQHQLEDAASCYDEARARLGASEQRAVATVRFAEVLDQLGKRRRARAILESLLLGSMHEATASHRAVTLLRAWRRASGGVQAEVDFLLGIASQLSAAGEGVGCRLLCELHTEIGRVRLRQKGKQRLAVRSLRQATAIAAGTVWLDDAEYWLARALRHSGELEAALRAYDHIIDQRAASWGIGSYSVIHLDDALFESAEVFEQLGDTKAAVAAFERLADLVPDSRLIDDASYRAAKLRYDGGATNALREFVAAHPNSRFSRDIASGQGGQRAREQP